MSFISAIQSGIRNYAKFKGRASRSEYWWWTLFTFLVQIAVSGFGDGIGGVVSLAILLPSLAVQVRRLHDTNRTGWWILWPIVSLGIALVALIVAAISGTTEFSDPSEWDPTEVLDGVSGGTIAVIAVALLVALVTGIANLVFTLQRSQPTENRFGPPPPPRLPT